MRKLLSLTFLLFAIEGHCASTGKILAEEAMDAKLSEGFEARMNVYVVENSGKRTFPMKIALIGAFGRERQRIIARGISPASIHDKFYAAERSPSGKIRAVSWDGTGNAAPFDAGKGIFSSGIVLRDLLSPWFSWANQREEGSSEAGDIRCTLLLSRNGEGESVESCLDHGLSLRTRMFGKERSEIRSIQVKETMKTGSGRIAARKLSVREQGGRTTEIEAYAGDEEYRIPPGAFSRLDGAEK